MSNFGSFEAFFCNFDFQNCLLFTCKNLKPFGLIIYLPQLCNKKVKFSQIFEVLAKKTLLKFEFCPVHISVTIHCKITGVFCSVSKDIPIVQCSSHFFKMLDFGSFLAIFAILVSKIVLFLILSLMQNSIHLIANCRPAFANNNSTVGI